MTEETNRRFQEDVRALGTLDTTVKMRDPRGSPADRMADRAPSP